jgi:hypothetical protein
MEEIDEYKEILEYLLENKEYYTKREYNDWVKYITKHKLSKTPLYEIKDPRRGKIIIRPESRVHEYFRKL